MALLGESGFLSWAYLAGGSALALQLGHRKSLDFDFFTDKNFDAEEVTNNLKKIGKYQTREQQTKTMTGVFNNVKFSLFFYQYPLIRPAKVFSKIRLASSEDIAAMKLTAIGDRGTKKDFIDLYFMVNRLFSLDKMLEFYEEKYHLLEVNKFTLLKSLQYFEEADLAEMPKMVVPIEWKKVKSFFQGEAIRLWKSF